MSSEKQDDKLIELLGRLGEAGITGTADITGHVLDLVGRTIEAVGRAATAIDPFQFLFIAGTALVAINYFDTTEPYATIIRRLKLHQLILLLHAPGTTGQDTQKFLDAVNQCIKEHNDAGVSIPDNLASLATASNFLNIGHNLENLIPGLGILDTFVTGLFNSFGAQTPQQILANIIPTLQTWCAKDIEERRRTPQIPPGAPATTVCVFSWRYQFTGNLGITWATRTFTDVDTAIRSWDATNLAGAAGNLLEVTTCDAPSIPPFGGVGPPVPAYHSETTRVIKTSTFHSDIN